MTKKQTAVEIILKKFNLLSDKEFNIWLLNKCNQLKELEKQQIIDAWIEGKENKVFGNTIFEDAQQYYNENFSND